MPCGVNCMGCHNQSEIRVGICNLIASSCKSSGNAFIQSFQSHPTSHACPVPLFFLTLHIKKCYIDQRKTSNKYNFGLMTFRFNQFRRLARVLSKLQQYLLTNLLQNTRAPKEKLFHVQEINCAIYCSIAISTKHQTYRMFSKLLHQRKSIPKLQFQVDFQPFWRTVCYNFLTIILLKLWHYFEKRIDLWPVIRNHSCCSFVLVKPILKTFC